MADLVLGLAKSAVEGTLTAAKSAIDEEVKLKKGMQRDLVLISEEFEMMHSFLNVAKDRAADEMVRTMVRQVRNMALDVEDCIESAVFVDIKSHWWRRLLPFCMLAAAPDAPLEHAVGTIELLKTCAALLTGRPSGYAYLTPTMVAGSSCTPSSSKSQACASDNHTGAVSFSMSGTIEGSVIVLGSNNMGALVTVKKAHLGIVTMLAFCDDSRTLLSTSFDSTARVTSVGPPKSKSTSIWPVLLVIILAILVYYCMQHKVELLAMLSR